MTSDQLKVLLSQPIWLFGLMLLASLANGLKQVTDAQRNGSSATISSYWKMWPETLGTIIANVLGFAILILTDQLNFASALGIGYGANSVVDLLRSGGRSATLAPTSTEGKSS